MSSDVEARLDRLESTEAIRQLASRYALAIDVRDLDALVALFVEDVRVGRNRSGRPALKAWFDDFLRNRFRETAHLVMNHVIEFQNADEANGLVYCRAEHELGDRFVIQQMQYRDQYARRDGIWLFERRLPLAWYATDVLDRPVGAKKVRWPDTDPAVGQLPGWWGSWEEYWTGPPADGISVRSPAAPGRWLDRLKRRTPE